MDYIATIGAIAMIAGILVVVVGALGATKSAKNKFVKTKIGAVAVGVIIVAAGGLIGGVTALTDFYEGLTTPPAQTYSYTYTQQQQQQAEGYTLAEFQITPAAFSAGNLTLNAAKTIFSLPAIANTTSHAIRTLSNAAFVQPSMRFTLNPLLWDGALTTDTATVYFEVIPGQQYIYPAAGSTYKFLTETSGNVNARFNNSGNTITQYEHGQLSCGVTGSMTVYVNLTLNSDSCSRIDNAYDPFTTTIRFYNNGDWSQTYTLSFFISSFLT